MFNISPAQLKKYGLYAITSFFMGLSIFLLKDILVTRNNEIIYQREKEKRLEQILYKQLELEKIQKNLLDSFKYAK